MLKVDLMLIKWTVVETPAKTLLVGKMNVPEPKAFNAKRSAKELENFLWDMEQYFAAARIHKLEQVTITSMYLLGNAKLWWQICIFNDASADRLKIDSWERL